MLTCIFLLKISLVACVCSTKSTSSVRETIVVGCFVITVVIAAIVGVGSTVVVSGTVVVVDVLLGVVFESTVTKTNARKLWSPVIA